MYLVAAYLAYLTLSVTATVWVGRTLFHNGKVFLLDAFHGRQELANSVNHLLIVGFYLVNAGYVGLALRTGEELTNTRQAMELVSEKTGIVLLVLGGMHFFNLYVLNQLRKRGTVRHGAQQEGGWVEGGRLGKVLD